MVSSGAALAWLLVVAIALVAHGESEEIQTLRMEDDSVSLGESADMEEYTADSDAIGATSRLLSQADELIRAHEKMVSAAPADVAAKIQQIQADIANIKGQRSKLQQEAVLAKQNADNAAPSESEQHMKVHISAGAKDQDLSVAEDSKTKELATLHQSGAAAPSLYSTEQFDKEWTAMRGKLKGMLSSLHNHVEKIKGIAQKHYDALKVHMAKLKETIKAEQHKRMQAEKATQEKAEKSQMIQSKEHAAKSAEKEAKGAYKKFQVAVAEKKQKAADEVKQKAEKSAQEAATKEAKMKALMAKLAALKGQLSGDDALKREIERLKADARKNAETYERTTKAHEREMQKQKQDADAAMLKSKGETDKEATRADTSEKNAVAAKEVAAKSLDKEKSRANTAEKKVEVKERDLANQKSLLATAKQALASCKKKMQELTTAYEIKLTTEKKNTQTQADLKRDAVAKFKDGERVIARMKREAATLNSRLKRETAARTKADALARKYKRDYQHAKAAAATMQKRLEAKLKAQKEDLEGKLKLSKEEHRKCSAQLDETKLKLTTAETQAKECKKSLATRESELRKIQQGMASVGKIAEVHDSTSAPVLQRTTP